MTSMSAATNASGTAAEVEQLLTDLETYVVQQRSKLVETTPLLDAIRQWRKALKNNPAALRLLIDIEIVPALVAVRHPVASGLLFFVPVVAAWLLLMGVEFLYSRSSSQQSFFYWWSAQPLGPFAYSGLIAVTLVFVLAVQGQKQVQQNRADQVERMLESFGAQLAVAVAALPSEQHDDSERLSLAAGALAAAGDRLSNAAESMRFDRTSFDRSVDVAERAERAMATLEAATQALADQVVALTTALEELPPAVADAESRLAPARAVAEGLVAAGAQVKRQGQEVKADLDRLASEILPQATKLGADASAAAAEANRSLPQVAEVAAALQLALTAIRENQQLSAKQLEHATRLHALLDEGVGGPAE